MQSGWRDRCCRLSERMQANDKEKRRFLKVAGLAPLAGAMRDVHTGRVTFLEA